MAIAFNAAADGGNATATSLTYSYTCSSGSNRLLIVVVLGDTTLDDVTGVTYAGASMTQSQKILAIGASNRIMYLYYLLNPSSGANNVVVSASSSHFLGSGAADYTGVNAGDASTTGQGSGSVSTLTTSLTTVADNSWTILSENGYNANNPPSASTGLVRRTFDAAFGGWGLFDSNGPVHPAGSYSMTTTRTSVSATITHTVASFSPSAGGGFTPGGRKTLSSIGTRIGSRQTRAV